MSIDTIIIKGLEVDAVIGVYDYERTAKQKLIIDIEMQYDSSQAVASDNIKHALDYHKITTDIIDFVSKSSYQLIETLAHNILELITANKLVEKANVTLWKPEALKQAQNISVSVSSS